MAWLQDLAGKAENLLNKIDQNAANVLNDASLQSKEESVTITVIEPNRGDIKNNYSSRPTSNAVPAQKLSSDSDSSVSGEGIGGITDTSVHSTEEGSVATVFERTFKPDYSSSRTASVNNYSGSDDISKYEEKIRVLELQNQELNKQLLNMQHLYNEVKNDNENLLSQVDRANESVVAAQLEMEQYRARAQRILQEKEKIISFKEDSVDKDDDRKVLTMYNEELKKDLKFQEEKNFELTGKLQNMSMELTHLQQQFITMEKTNQQTTNLLQTSLANERKLRIVAEDELKLKTKELQKTLQELLHQTNAIALNNQELNQIKEQLKQSSKYKGNDDLESRLNSLTQILMTKQNTIETVTTERNALRLQLEKLEKQHHNISAQKQGVTLNLSNVNDTDDAKSQVPQFLRMNLFDAGMTRRVKKAYSTLDAVSVRTGVFLRRYPLARVFVFSYCVLLHLWVIVILSTYIPSGR